MTKQFIFLVGFMGVGKTTLGKRLAHHLKIPFIDTDQLIVQQEGMEINKYFDCFGEDQFRALETKVVQEINQNNETAVIAVGGGLPCFNENMNLMNKIGVTIYLQRPAKELYQRLLQGKDKRPLIRDLEPDELLAFITDLLHKREDYYLKATHTLNRNQQTVEYIKELLSVNNT